MCAVRRQFRMLLPLPRWALASLVVASVPGCLKVPPDLSEEPKAPVKAPTSASEVLGRYVAALGGEEAIRAKAQRTVEARIVIRAEDGCEDASEGCLPEDQSGSFLYQSTATGQLYQRTVVGDSVEEHGYDGTQGWALLGNEALQVDTPEEAALAREEGLLHWYLDLDARKIETSLLPSKAHDSQGNAMTLDGISWRSPQAPLSKELWFSRETGLLHEEISRDGEAENQQSQTVVYSDYQTVDGISVPHAIMVINRLGSRKQVVEFITQRVQHDPIPPEKFAIPTLPEFKAKPDPLLTRLQQAEGEAKSAPQDVAAQVEWARAAFMAAHFEEAKKAATGALALDAKEPEALLTLTRIHSLRGEHEAALKLLQRAAKAGVKEEVIAREEAWILHRKGDFPRLADALDTAGNSVLAGRYRAFVGKPWTTTPPKSCVQNIALAPSDELALLPVTIGGTATTAIFDTGAADLILTETLADALEVTIRSRTKIAEGMPEIGHGQIEQLQVGDLVLRNVPVNVFDDDSVAQMAGTTSTPVAAVFGAGLLQAFVVRLDFPGKELRIVPTSRKCKAEADALRQGPSAPLYLHETHYLYAFSTMNDAEGMYLLNTGMRGADMTANRMANDYAGIRMPTLRSDETPMVTVPRFEIPEGIAFKDVKEAYAVFQQSQSSDGFRVDGMIGLGVLGQRPFVLDFEKLRLYVP